MYAPHGLHIFFLKAVQYLQQAVAFDDKDGHTWEELAYCYLMINDLQNSYTAYQHALYHIQNPKVGVAWVCMSKIILEIFGALSLYLRLSIVSVSFTRLFAGSFCLIGQDARLWYGIGLLYDCYGSYGHAIEAFDACLKMDPNFELDHEASRWWRAWGGEWGWL